MTKADIVNEVAKATGLEKLNVQKVVEAFMETVKDSVSRITACISAVSAASLLRNARRRQPAIFRSRRP